MQARNAFFMCLCCASNMVRFPPLQCTLAHYNSNSLLHPHSETLKHFSKMSDFFFLLLFAVCSKLLPVFSHLIHSTLSSQRLPFIPVPSLLFPLHYSRSPKINHGSTTPPPCSLSLYSLNPSLTIQLSCLWRIPSGWVVYICMRPNVNWPFLLDFGKTIMRTPQAAACKNRNPLSTVMLTNIGSPKKLQIIIITTNLWARLPDK